MNNKIGEVPEIAKNDFNWNHVEDAYRAGVLSIRAISKTFGPSEAAIRKKAKTAGWRRDLRDQVDQQVRTELIRGEVRTLQAHAREEAPEHEREIVAVAAASIIQVVREHRERIRTARQIVNMLVAQLGEAASQREELEDEIDQQTIGDRDGKRQAFLMRAVSLPQHAATLKDLSVAMRNLVGLERQAFNIADGLEPKAHQPAPEMKALEGFDKLQAAFDRVLGKHSPHAPES
jgi:hypothetical protein